MHGSALRYILREFANILEYKIDQDTKQLTRVMLVVDKTFSESNEQSVIQGFKDQLGNAVTVQIEYVQEIPAEKSGKFRFVISHAV